MTSKHSGKGSVITHLKHSNKTMQIKTTMHYTHMRIVKIKKTGKTKLRQDVKQLEISYVTRDGVK